MGMRSRSTTLLCAAAVMWMACGGTPKPSAGAPKSEGTRATSTSSAASTSAEPSKPAETEQASRRPRSIITDPDVTFVLAFDQSEPGKAAEEKCTASSKNDSKKFNECMSRAHDRIQVEAIRFKEDDDRVWWWQSLQRKGPSFALLNKVQIEFGAETDRGIAIKPKGKSEVQIEVPNNFTIALKDPAHGRLVYEAKIGATSK